MYLCGGNQTENIMITWLKRIFNVTTISTLVAILGVCIPVAEYVEKHGGKFVAFVNNKEAASHINRNVLIYMDQDSVDLSQMGIVPTMTNPTKYPVQDMLLMYEIEARSSKIIYADYYSVHQTVSGTQITNNDKTLYAKSTVPRPFYKFVMYGDGEVSINLQVTYRGVNEPFTYHTFVKANKISDEQLIYKNAYDFITANQIDTVDLYIFKDSAFVPLLNYSAEKINKATDTVNDEREILPADFQKENDEKIKEVQEKESVAWYIVVISIVLFILAFFGIYYTSLLIDFLFSERKKMSKIEYGVAIFFFMLFFFGTYLLLYYAYYILHIINEASVNLLTGLIFYLYLWCFMGLTTLLGKVFNWLFNLITHKQKEYTSATILSIIVVLPLWLFGLAALLVWLEIL